MFNQSFSKFAQPAFGIGLGLLIVGLPLQAFANTDLDELCQKFPHNSQCAGYVPPASNSTDSVRRDPATNLPVVTLDGDWRSSKLDIPWSQLVLVRDQFEGDYLAVFDKNYSGNNFLSGSESGVVTKWTRGQIGIFAYKKAKSCGFLTCRNVSDASVVGNTLEIKVGEQIFRLEGEDGTFVITDELAAALKSATPGQIMMRITLAGSGLTITNEIGEGTVQALRQVYQPQNTASSAQ